MIKNNRQLWIEVKPSPYAGIRVLFCCNGRRRVWPNKAAMVMANFLEIEPALVYAKQLSNDLGNIPVRLLDVYGRDVISHPPPLLEDS